MNKTQQQEFFDAIQNYQFINQNGRMDLEHFCVVLSKCFAADGVLDISPQPRSIYNLLLELIFDKAETYPEPKKLKSLWVQPQKLVDWTPDFFDFYPDRIRTLIHIGGLVAVFDKWISAIGYELMDLPSPEHRSKYFDWINPEWTHVYEFIEGFHNSLFSFSKDLDRKLINRDGYSLHEALFVASKNNIDFDEAVALLKRRKEAHSEAISKMRDAISSGFFLEAIALQECIISNCLYNYLDSKTGKQKLTSLYEMLKKVTRKNSGVNIEDRELFERVNIWREKRNKSIHGFVTSKTEDLASSMFDFSTFSEETAKEGAELCVKVCEWLDAESVEFLETRFPKKSTTVN